MEQPSPRVLIVEDDPQIAELLEYVLEQEGFAVDMADGAVTALQKIYATRFDLVVMDVRLDGEIDGIEIARRGRRRYPSLRVLFISGRADPVAGDPALDDFVKKPFKIREFLGCVWELLYRDLQARQDGTSRFALSALQSAKENCLKSKAEAAAAAGDPAHADAIAANLAALNADLADLPTPARRHRGLRRHLKGSACAADISVRR